MLCCRVHLICFNKRVRLFKVDVNRDLWESSICEIELYDRLRNLYGVYCRFWENLFAIRVEEHLLFLLWEKRLMVRVFSIRVRVAVELDLVKDVISQMSVHLLVIKIKNFTVYRCKNYVGLRILIVIKSYVTVCEEPVIGDGFILES